MQILKIRPRPVKNECSENGNMHDPDVLLRLFFALPCPAPVRTRITHWRQGLDLPGKLVPPANLHLTLVFLGAQPVSRLGQLTTLAGQLEVPAFALHLDTLDCWHDGLLHLAPGQAPDALLHLQNQLQQCLIEAGFTLEQRRYRPHLTLARHSDLPGTSAPASFTWTVEHFALYASSNEEYQTLQSWPLLPRPLMR
ncbi:MAG TPA: RNA 2',3'-cyclic phosphodiesterase [Pseudomonas sp.]|nr:RNA 2',3'-cyclic phosphodiesterase [Pseudomonas sp.]